MAEKGSLNLNQGVKLGQTGWRIKKEIVLPEKDRFKHEYIIGHNGCGKETFMFNQAVQDIQNGNGICFIDSYGDSVENLLKYIPKERANDIIYFDVSDKERPIGLNIFDIDSKDEIEFVVNETTDMFISMFGPEIFGPRIQEYFKYGSISVLEDFDDKPTIFDSVRMFTDDGFREFKMKKITNPIVISRWERTYNTMGDREKQEIIPYFSSKFVSFQTNPCTRNIIGQSKSSFNMDEVVNNKKILLVNLNKGVIGETDGNLIGKILLSKINLALKKRAMKNKEDLSPFFLYLDNFQSYRGWSAYENFLKDATNCKLGVIMSHMYLDQLKKEYPYQINTNMTSMIFNTVETICMFKMGPSDAEILEKEVSQKFSKADLQNLKSMQGIIKTQNFLTKISIEQNNENKDENISPILKEYSSKKYGRRGDLVEAETGAKLGID